MYFAAVLLVATGDAPYCQSGIQILQCIHVPDQQYGLLFFPSGQSRNCDQKSLVKKRPVKLLPNGPHYKMILSQICVFFEPFKTKYKGKGFRKVPELRQKCSSSMVESANALCTPQCKCQKLLYFKRMRWINNICQINCRPYWSLRACTEAAFMGCGRGFTTARCQKRKNLLRS